MLPNLDIKYHLTLVHGTFARDALWTQDQSALCSAILKALGAHAAFSRFTWTGKNSHAARVAAGRELAAFLRSARETYPNASRFIIAHSHGGNVAFYAHRLLAREIETRSNIITLATPFIRSRLRKISLAVRTGWLIFLALIVISLLFGVLYPLVDIDPGGIFPEPTDGSGNWPAAALALGQLVITTSTLYLLTRTYTRRQSRALLDRLAWPDDGRINLLTISYRWDEAGTYLRVLDWITRSLSRSIWYVMALVPFGGALYLALTVYAAYFNPSLYQSSFITNSIGLPHVVFIGILFFFTTIIFLTFIGALALMLNLLRGNPFGFGWERPSSSFLVNIQARDTPEGLSTQSQEHCRIPIGAFAKANKGLAHCLIYEDPRIHEKIIDWITGRRRAGAEECRIAEAKRRAESDEQRRLRHSRAPPLWQSWHAALVAGWLMVMALPPLGAWLARPSSPVGPGVVSVLTPQEERALKSKDTFKECTNCPLMTVVPAGSFTMGSSASEPRRYPNTGPQHTVTIAARLAVGQFEVTFDEWDACVADGGCNGHKPSDERWGRGRRPVINVSWNHAKAYVAWLAKTTGKPYRLLSEAEYEYATRTGTTTAYPWGDAIGNNNANCNGCGSQWDGKQTAPVGSFAANQFGLYDMVGNVWEWTEDCYHDSYSGAPADGSAWTKEGCWSQVLRGGGWNGPPEHLFSSSRAENSIRNQMTGFRVGRALLAP